MSLFVPGKSKFNSIPAIRPGIVLIQSATGGKQGNALVTFQEPMDVLEQGDDGFLVKNMQDAARIDDAHVPLVGIRLLKHLHIAHKFLEWQVPGTNYSQYTKMNNGKAVRSIPA